MPDENDLVIEEDRLRPSQLHWLRRPELDTEYAEMWVRPDGKLHAQPKGKTLILGRIPRML